MSLQETVTVTAQLTFTTQNGEVPSDTELADLIVDQMAGELDPDTGLACMAVTVTGRTA